MSRVLLAALLTLAAATAFGAEPPPPVTGSHGDLECADCHDGPSTLDCDTCHDPKINIHPVHVEPTAPMPPEFALGPEGTLLCRSCHRLHGGREGSFYLAAETGNRSEFCALCHGERMSRTNPHNAQQGTDRCAFCHASVPGKGTLGGLGTARLDIVKLCDFCHGALARDHPRNIDPTLSLPKGLPLGPDGEWTCVTCHNPHGTTETTHYVRAEFARHFERGLQENPHVDSYFACKGCHRTAIADEIRAPDYALRYKGDINVLCVSCHVTDRGHHPTGLPPPPFMREDMRKALLQVPLDERERIDCWTCHDNGCSSGKQAMTIRHYDRKTLRNDLCWICHQRTEFSRVSPHVDDMALCVRCHESTPVPGISTGLMTIPKMVCLQCHDVKPNPDESLPLGPAGEVTCVTCHNPHATPEPVFGRLRAERERICELCHWR